VAHQVLALAEQNQREEAFAVIERTRATILGQMIEMFEEFRQGLSDSRREIAAITELNGQDIAFAIDSAEAIQSFAGKSKPTPDLIARSQNRFLDGVAEFGDEQTLVLLLNLEQILDYCGLSEEKSGN
jgi:chemotaxis signal transduction protein